MSTPAPRDWPSLLRALGGPAVLARDLGLDPQLGPVRQWVRRGIPGRHWAAVARTPSAVAAGVTLEVLAAAGAGRPADPS